MVPNKVKHNTNITLEYNTNIAYNIHALKSIENEIELIEPDFYREPLRNLCQHIELYVKKHSEIILYLHC